jgi:hypothetical protein
MSKRAYGRAGTPVDRQYHVGVAVALFVSFEWREGGLTLFIGATSSTNEGPAFWNWIYRCSIGLFDSVAAFVGGCHARQSLFFEELATNWPTHWRPPPCDRTTTTTGRRYREDGGPPEDYAEICLYLELLNKGPRRFLKKPPNIGGLVDCCRCFCYSNGHRWTSCTGCCSKLVVMYLTCPVMLFSTMMMMVMILKILDSACCSRVSESSFGRGKSSFLNIPLYSAGSDDECRDPIVFKCSGRF